MTTYSFYSCRSLEDNDLEKLERQGWQIVGFTYTDVDHVRPFVFVLRRKRKFDWALYFAVVTLVIWTAFLMLMQSSWIASGIHH